MAEGATVAIPNDVIQPIVQARIQASIVEALKRSDTLIDTVVAAALTQKVNSDGKVDSYSSSNKYTILEVMATQYIREAARDALKQHLDEAREQIKKRVSDELKKKHTIIAAALVDGLAKSISTTYGFSLTVALNSKKD